MIGIDEFSFGNAPNLGRRLRAGEPRAFSAEEDTGSAKENATNQGI